MTFIHKPQTQKDGMTSIAKWHSKAIFQFHWCELFFPISVNYNGRFSFCPMLSIHTSSTVLKVIIILLFYYYHKCVKQTCGWIGRFVCKMPSSSFLSNDFQIWGARWNENYLRRTIFILFSLILACNLTIYLFTCWNSGHKFLITPVKQ